MSAPDSSGRLQQGRGEGVVYDEEHFVADVATLAQEGLRPRSSDWRATRSTPRRRLGGGQDLAGLRDVDPSDLPAIPCAARRSTAFGNAEIAVVRDHDDTTRRYEFQHGMCRRHTRGKGQCAPTFQGADRLLREHARSGCRIGRIPSWRHEYRARRCRWRQRPPAGSVGHPQLVPDGPQ